MHNGYDVVVLGSGAAGLTAALAAAVEGAARVAVFEKAELIGGTTALSGGTVWIPANQPAGELGVEDSRARGLEYLASLSNGMILPELAEALVDGGPEYVDFVHEHTELRFQLVEGYPDYHPEWPGGLPGGGRSIEVGLVSLAELGEWADRLAGVPSRLLIRESPLGGGTGVLSPDELARRDRTGAEGLGRGLVAGLLGACLRHGVEVFTSSRGLRLLTADGAVTGVEIEGPAGAGEVSAGAVVLATGGFEYDPELVRDFLRGPITRPFGAPTNTGDGLRMAMRVGARLGNMREAWWAPALSVPGTRRDGAANGLLASRERALPGSVMVNGYGRRFANEAANYNAFGGAFHQFDASRFEYPNLPAFMIFDQSTVERFGVLGGAPGAAVPRWVTRAGSVGELAGRLGLPAEQVEATITAFNANARAGVDPDFGRGESAFDRFPGGRTTLDPDSPHSTLGPVETAPFYGVRVESSLLGTKGGPRTDRAGRVLNVDGDVIGGLYAAGNVMANPTGMVYGGAGATLAVAGVWGRNAGRAAVRDRAAAPHGVVPSGATDSVGNG
ncbi:FAD-dependent oxidoreductase [Frankia sp. CNm7]|uniref:FAD-dependent oxidoreductase n=1 Tax=Frankia nepalensis TaxID=1836974 RepID=A0A937RB68_9ACTN|nr:FAD-dependent oxidoreductase [Frankia nepalensis]MBL7500912.1 FAD-dependent oxidoreductase [Frankia nepalensis]MBL7510113.1 FAD-dependent oxidoreductase [Frankia nepalensis]MBL7519977.1 FAD-dependent oxidoreductase [Frankia nepalensis]MBL7625699.1 FAD-dependent oxidoreductase [Frankia nepalensis]